MPTRRQFFASCTALAVTASLTPAVALGAPFRSCLISLEEISFLDFAATVNTEFLVLTESRPVAGLRLAGANLLGAGRFAVSNCEDARNENFSLLFVGGENAALQSGMYEFEHESIGCFEMFISPVGPDEPGCCYYEAVFNRPHGRRASMADIRTLHR